MPTVPEPAPMLNAEGEALERYRASAFALLSVSGMSSCCQVQLLHLYDSLHHFLMFVKF